MFLFLLFLHFHSCSSFFPVPLIHLLYSLFYLFSLGDDTKWPSRVDVSLNPNTINLSPETDNCPSWISGRERMTVENISRSISTKECCRPRRGLNPRPPGLQSDGASNWATEAPPSSILQLHIYGNRKVNIRKPTFEHVHPAEIQINLCICIGWSESLLGTFWIASDVKFLHADNKEIKKLYTMCISSRKHTHRYIILTPFKLFI